MRAPRARCTSPDEASSAPTMIRKSVVLPTPLGPTEREPRTFRHREADIGEKVHRAERFGEGGNSDEGHIGDSRGAKFCAPTNSKDSRYRIPN